MKIPTIVEVKRDPKLWLPWFEDESFNPWVVHDKAVFGLPMTPDELDIYRSCTGRSNPPTQQVKRVYDCIGRRGGKSISAGAAAAYIAAFRDHSKYRTRGEKIMVLVIAADRRQAKIIFAYIRSFFIDCPLLKPLVVRETQSLLELSNGCSIEVATSSFRSVRGYSCAAVLIDEGAYLPTGDSANPDVELLTALGPTLLTVPDSILMFLSTPYRRLGVLYEAEREFYGKDDPDTLYWKAGTLTMNPAANRAAIESAFESDPVAAAAEYDAEFRRDIESYVDIEQLQSLVVSGRTHIPPVRHARMHCFIDPSGGRSDSMTAAFCYRQDNRLILARVLERKPPFSPENVVAEFAAVMREYGCKTATADKYAAEWPVDAFRRQGIKLISSEKTKSEIYLEILPVVNASRIELLDHPKMISQFSRLERRTSRSGRDIVDHGPSTHDDVANAVAGSLWLCEKAASLPRRGAGIAIGFIGNIPRRRSNVTAYRPYPGPKILLP